MKPTVPETGTVLKTEGDYALVLLKSGHSCKGCGAAKIGLCRAGAASMMLTAKNIAGARPGDTVIIGIDEYVRWRGYFLAYIFPLLAFIVGALLGYIAGEYYSIRSLDVITGLVAFVVISSYTFIRLRKLDRSYRMAIKKVISDGVFTTDLKSDEERRYEDYCAVSR